MVEQIYKRNPILRHSHHPLHSPLLPLPYGDVHLPGEYPTDRTGSDAALYKNEPFELSWWKKILKR